MRKQTSFPYCLLLLAALHSTAGFAQPDMDAGVPETTDAGALSSGPPDAAVPAQEDPVVREQSLLKIIQEDPEALRTVREYVALLSKSAPAQVEALCQGLLTKERPAQAFECILSAESPSVDLCLEVLSKLSSISAERLVLMLDEKRSLRRYLSGVSECRDGDKQAMGPPGPENDRRTAAIYLKLADNAGGAFQSPRAACFLSYAAWSCISSVLKGEECSAEEAPGMYAQMLAIRDRSTFRQFEAQLFSMKEGLYTALEVAEAQPGSHKSALSALFNLHISLARVYAETGRKSAPVQDASYHMMRAEHLWEKLNPGQPFPPNLRPKERSEACRQAAQERYELDTKLCNENCFKCGGYATLAECLDRTCRVECTRRKSLFPFRHQSVDEACLGDSYQRCKQICIRADQCRKSWCGDTGTERNLCLGVAQNRRDQAEQACP